MGGRLSEQALAQIYDSGLNPFARGDKTPVRMRLSSIDLNAILAHPNAKRVIRALPPRDLYIALKQRGLAESLDVLELVSAEQFQRFCDYDAWHEDRLVPKQIFSWLKLLNNISPKLMYKRFRALDEEYQIATLSPLIRVYDSDDYERMSETEQDSLFRFPGDELFCSVISDDLETRSDVEELMSACMSEDMAYTMSLVMHSGYALATENEHLLAQFRRARLEEDGFVSYEEAVCAFYPVNIDNLWDKWHPYQPKNQIINQLSVSEREPFLGQILKRLEEVWEKNEREKLTTSIMHLANSLCVVARLEPDDLAGLKQLLASAYGLVSLGLEFLARRDGELAVKILGVEHPKSLFQIGCTLLRYLQHDFVEGFKKTSFSKFSQLEKSWLNLRFASIQTWFDKQVEVFGFQETEQLKSLFNRFPLVPNLKESADPKSITFEPVASLQDLYVLQSFCDEWLVKFKLMEILQPSTNWTTNIDRMIATACAKALLGQNFSFEPLSVDAQNEVRNLSEESLQERKDKLIKYVQTKLLEDPSFGKSFISSYMTIGHERSNVLANRLKELVILTCGGVRNAANNDTLNALCEIDRG